MNEQRRKNETKSASWGKKGQDNDKMWVFYSKKITTDWYRGCDNEVMPEFEQSGGY
jgi:hypothetical protein